MSPAVVRGVHYLSLGVCVVFVLVIARDQWFYLDEFVYLGYSRDALGAVGALFENYNQHWSTYPILIYRALRDTVGLGAYWPYVLIGVAGHLLVVHLLWRLMLRLDVAPLVATGLALVVLASPTAVEHVLWGVNIGFLGSLAAGLGSLLLVPLDGPWTSRDRWAVVIATLALPFSGMSIVMVGTVTLVLLVSRGWRVAVRFAVVPVAVAAAWSVVYGSAEVGGVNRVPQFVVDGLIGAGRLLLGGSHFLGIAFFAAYFVMLAALARTVPGSRSMPFTLLLCASGTLVVVATGRAGVNHPDAPRYAYNVVVLSMPAIGVLLTRLAVTRVGAVAFVVACMALTAVGAVKLRDNAIAEAQGEGGVRAQVLGAASILRDGAAQVVPHAPLGAVMLTLTVDDVRRWIRDGRLPTLGASEEGILRAATEIQIDVGRAALAPVVLGECRTLAPGERRALRPTQPASWIGRAPSDANLRVGFVESSGATHSRPVRVHGRFFLSDLHPGATFMVLHEGGAPVELCTGVPAA